MRPPTPGLHNQRDAASVPAWREPRTVAVVAALLAACGGSSDLARVPDPPEGYAYAYAAPDCAPWDGRAVQILLISAPSDAPDTVRPQLRLAIYPRDGDVAGTTYRWPTEPEMATGARCDAGPCEIAIAGEVKVAAARPDGTLEGRLRLRFANGETISGGFRAAWLARQVFCG